MRSAPRAGVAIVERHGPAILAASFKKIGENGMLRQPRRQIAQLCDASPNDSHYCSDIGNHLGAILIFECSKLLKRLHSLYCILAIDRSQQRGRRQLNKKPPRGIRALAIHQLK